MMNSNFPIANPKQGRVVIYMGLYTHGLNILQHIIQSITEAIYYLKFSRYW
jgi:hypothetical protein